VLDPGELAGGLDPVYAGHANVHQHHVDLARRTGLDGLGTVGCFADHLDVGLRLKDHPQAGADQGLVVGEDDADHVCAAYGRWALTTNPPWAPGPAST
jgi:hypothetical protein